MTGNAGLVNLKTEEEKQEANVPKQCRGEEGSEEDGEEDDLFEINLDSVSDARSSDCLRFPARTGSVLLANCLLPAADISGAVPATSRAWSHMVGFRGFLYVEKLGTASKKLNYF